MSSLFVFHQGGGNNGTLWYKTSQDGKNWTTDQQVPKVGMSSDPSAVQFNGKLYCFHQGYGNNSELWYDVLEGGSWARDHVVPHTRLSAGPSAVVYQENIYDFHQGQKDDTLWYNVFDGKNGPSTPASMGSACRLVRRPSCTTTRSTASIRTTRTM